MCTTEACIRTSTESKQTDPQMSGSAGKLDSKNYPGTEVMQKMTVSEHLSMYWQFFFSGQHRTPEEALPQEKVHVAELLDRNRDQLKAAWLGHSSLLIAIDGYTVLTDPIFEQRISLVGPTSFHKDLPLEVKDLPHVDVVIISHDHYDHLNAYSIRNLAEKAGVFVIPSGVGARLSEWGITKEKIIELNWWQEYALDEHLTLAATPAQHFSGRGLTDRNRTLWASWTILGPNHRIFFSGDSGYFDGFKQIGRKYGPFDTTFIECGAYNEKWSGIHMFPEQTVQAHRDLGGNILQPIHWATFNLSLHPWYEPMERLIAAAGSAGVTTSTPVMGRIVDYTTFQPTFRPPDHWWKPAMARSLRRVNPQLATAGR